MIVTLGQRIRECREARGWTRPELAEKLRISSKTVALIERGQRAPYSVRKLAKLFNMPLSEFLENVDEDSYWKE